MVVFKDYEDLLRSFQVKAPDVHEQARVLLWLRARIRFYCCLDSFEKGYFTVDDILDNPEVDTRLDYISLPAYQLRQVFESITGNLRSRILRENTLVPLHKANEFNGRSIAWLGKKPGRTIREKLAASKSIMAVKRSISFDTGENRLFKAFCRKMMELIQLKENAFSDSCLSDDEMYLKIAIRKFLHTEEAEGIKGWENISPNNTLLSDKYYNVAWCGWNDMKDIGSLIKQDQHLLPKKLTSVLLLDLIGYMRNFVSWVQQPVRYEYRQGLFVLPNYKQVGFTNTGKMVVLQYNGDSTIQISVGKRINVLKVNVNEIEIVNFMGRSIKQLLSVDNLTYFVNNYSKTCLGKELAGNVQSETGWKPLHGETVVLDLFRLRPIVWLDGNMLRMPGRLLYQTVKMADDNIICSLSDSRHNVINEYYYSLSWSDAAFMSHYSNELYTYRIADVFDRNTESGKYVLQEILNGMRQQVSTDNLIFLYPDVYNDFQLTCTRRLAKMFYYKVISVPRSLGAVFSFIKDCMEGKGNTFDKDSVFIVLDVVPEGVSATVVHAAYNEQSGSQELKKLIPATKGVVWEHHPCKIITLARYKGKMGEWKQEDASYLLPGDNGNSRAVELNALENLGSVVRYTITEEVDNYIASRKNIFQGKKIELIIIAEDLLYLGGYHQQHVSEENLNQGVAVYYDLKKKAKGISLWRNYLPNLSIKQMIGKIELVEDRSFDFDGEEAKEISRPDILFTLQKDKKEYHFQLDMDDALYQNSYEAVVRHSAFPLSMDVECSLVMTYNYNDDNPYTLKFIPKDKRRAGFNEATVRWEVMNEYEYADLPYPQFPEAISWQEIENLPDNKEPGKNHNLFMDIANGIKNIVDLPSKVVVIDAVPDRVEKKIYLKCRSNNGRIIVLIAYKESFVDVQGMGINMTSPLFSALVDKYSKQNFYDDSNSDCSGNDEQGMTLYYLPNNLVRDYMKPHEIRFTDDEFLYEDKKDIEGWSWGEQVITLSVKRKNFVFKDDLESEFNKVYFYLTTYKDKDNRTIIKTYGDEKSDAKDILTGAYEIGHTYKLSEQSKDIVDIKRKGFGWLQFALHTMYSTGKCLASPDCQTIYKEKILDGYVALFKSYKEIKDAPVWHKLVEEYLKCLAIMNRDVQADIYMDFIDIIKRKKREKGGNFPNYFGFALGALETEEQKLLYREILEPVSDSTILALARAAWRNEKFIWKADLDDMLTCFEYACDYIVKCDLRSGSGMSDVARMLEFILAVYRLREAKKADVDKRLSLNNPVVKTFYDKLDYMIKEGLFKNFSTRIKINVIQDERYKEVGRLPDMIYAMMVYITGTDVANEIKISKIEEDDD